MASTDRRGVHSTSSQGEHRGQASLRSSPRAIQKEDAAPDGGRGRGSGPPPGAADEGVHESAKALPRRDVLRILGGGPTLDGVIDTNVLIRGITSTKSAGRILDAVRDRVVRPWFSEETWTEFDDVLGLWRAYMRVKPSAARDVRSALLEVGELRKVERQFIGCSDPNDDMFIDVLEQTPARWLCTDDGALHALDRPDVIGLGELVHMIEEVH